MAEQTNPISKDLKSLFSTLAEIPEDIRIESPLHQKQILIDGALREWTGDFHEVYSPILISNKETGATEQLLIGSYPIATTKETQEALDAAVRAYDGGRGAWPAMHINETVRSAKQLSN
jgi:glyceraldehyde-3-phosphate dehydrogenase (NADP+)